MVRYLTEVDHHDHEAIVALDEESGEGIGVARYVRTRERPEVAEVAVTVVDDWQGRGLGTRLLEVVSARAREEDIRSFTAPRAGHQPGDDEAARAPRSAAHRRSRGRHRGDRDADPRGGTVTGPQEAPAPRGRAIGSAPPAIPESRVTVVSGDYGWRQFAGGAD
jgi:GNAT superfamily N-acetyltransferase